MNLPRVSAVRKRIETVKPDEIQKALKFQYLVCGRAKEVVAYSTPNDKSGRNKPSGPMGCDVRLENFGEFEVALFNVYTQKRADQKRIIALPLTYEPWAEQLYKHFQNFGDGPVFNFSRQKLWASSKPYFSNMEYQIEKYKIVYHEQDEQTGEDLKLVKIVEPHSKPFTLHALRHLRATELVEYYGFSAFDLSIYGGWVIPQAFGRYVNLNWQSYIGKLLRKRTW